MRTTASSLLPRSPRMPIRTSTQVGCPRSLIETGVTMMEALPLFDLSSLISRRPWRLESDCSDDLSELVQTKFCPLANVLDDLISAGKDLQRIRQGISDFIRTCLAPVVRSSSCVVFRSVERHAVRAGVRSVPTDEDADARLSKRACDHRSSGTILSTSSAGDISSSATRCQRFRRIPHPSLIGRRSPPPFVCHVLRGLHTAGAR